MKYKKNKTVFFNEVVWDAISCFVVNAIKVSEKFELDLYTECP